MGKPFRRGARMITLYGMGSPNVRKVGILLEEAESELRLVISDNGGGMARASRDKGLGLRIMADRAKMVGGSFQVGPAPSRGTRLICLVPQVAMHV